VADLVVATVNVIANVGALVGTAHLEQASKLRLMWDVVLIDISTVLVFSLVPALRRVSPRGAFTFPTGRDDPDRVPNWIDYLFMAFNTTATFGPTTETVHAGKAKPVMILQVSISLVILLVLSARIVGLSTHH